MAAYRPRNPGRQDLDSMPYDTKVIGQRFLLFLQDQVLHFLKDIFDLDKVRYFSVETLAEDMLHLLYRRSELLLAYVGADSLRHLNGCNSPQLQLLPTAVLEARVQ